MVRLFETRTSLQLSKANNLGHVEVDVDLAVGGQAWVGCEGVLWDPTDNLGHDKCCTHTTSFSSHVDLPKTCFSILLLTCISTLPKSRVNLPE